MPLKATMAKPRNPNPEKRSKIFSDPPALHAQQEKPNNTKPGTDFLLYRVTLTVKCKPEKPQV